MQTPLNTGPGGMPPMRTRDGKSLEVTVRIQLLWALLIASVLVMGLPLPFRLIGGALALVAAWVGITVLTRMARARRIGLLLRRRTWPVSVGLGLSIVLTLSSALDAAFYPIVADREECVAGANTRVAQEDCLDATEDRLTSWMESLTGS